jgi:hypothetical protein
MAATEYGVMAVDDLMKLVELKDPNIIITLEDMYGLVQEANKIYEKEANLREAAKNTKDNFEKYLEGKHL